MGAENGHGGHDDIGEEDPFEALKEWNLVFGSEEDLQKAFQAMCDGALRNPDSDEEGEEDWEGEGGEAGLGGWFTAGSLAEEDERLEGVPGSQGPPPPRRSSSIPCCWKDCAVTRGPSTTV